VPVGSGVQHALLVHLPPPHDVPHLPQFNGSVVRSLHVPPQHALAVAVQSLLQVPQ